MLAMQRKLSTPFLVLLTLPATAMGFALSVQISVLSWILSTEYKLDIHEIGIVWAAGPLAGIIGQLLIGVISDRVWFWGGRRRPFIIIGGLLAVADDPGPALHRADLAEARLRGRHRRRHRRGARARPVDQRQLQPDALADHRCHAGRHRAHAWLHLDADGLGLVRRARLRHRRGLRQFHADLLCSRAGAGVLGAACAADRGAARAARHDGRGSRGGRQARWRQLLRT